MGILDMLKRGKSDSKSVDMPKADFPELPAEKMPPLPESSLPPLPGAEESSAIPDLPAPPSMETITSEAPKIPEVPELPSEISTAKMPALPDMPAGPKSKEPTIPDIPVAPESESKGPDTPNVPKPPVVVHKRELPKAKEEINIPSYEPEPMTKMSAELPVPPATGEFVPEKIPPLEGIGKVPEFRAEPAKPGPIASPLEKMKQDFTDEGMMASAMPVEASPKPARRSVKGPIFVKVSSFKDIMTHVEDTLSRFKEEDDIFFRVTDVKNSQDKQYEKYRLTLEDMQRKLLFIDKTLFEKR